MDNQKFSIRYPLDHYVQILVENAYNELNNQVIQAQWKRIRDFATVSLNQEGHIVIRCNNITKDWPEPALIGLLSHELSHYSMGSQSDSETSTDFDVIRRGLGTYLALERVIADKYSDHVVSRGKDRYLGYSTIRAHLSIREIKQLDRLLTDLGFITSSPE